MNADAIRALDAMEEVAACWRAVSMLASPDTPFSADQRSDFSILLDKLARDYQAASDRFSSAARRTA